MALLNQERQNPFCSLEPRHQTNTKRLSFDFLFDTDNYLSDPIAVFLFYFLTQRDKGHHHFDCDSKFVLHLQ